MKRRDILRLGGGALALTAVSPFSFGFAGTRTDRLFFPAGDIARIRANAMTPLLRPVVDAWKAEGTASLYTAIDLAARTRNVVRDFAAGLNAVAREATLHLIEPSAERERAILYGIEHCIDAPVWDFMVDGDVPIGIQRSSLANSRLLFAREVLGNDLPSRLEQRLLDAVAEKGCAACYRTIVGMDHPDTVAGWGFDEVHADLMDISLARWPEILGENNLRAIPTMGLGIGALALRDRDPRAGLWLDTAISSARHFLGTISADGSYFEGLSYVDYALRTLFQFLEAHERLDGSIKWGEEANFEGVARFVLAMQAGRKDNGEPDIVNFSDANYSTYPCVTSWIAKHTDYPVAQFATEKASRPGFFLDFLWYEPERPASEPPELLKNERLDLDWIIARTGWEPDDAVLAFRSGNPANHEHADRNSFLFKIHGERLLTDHFGAAYDFRDPKWILRLTEAHNAVLIDGKGHQYHNGEEGTNEGKAVATIVRYVDDGDRVWWCSDATHGYKLVNADIKRVRRTVLYAKPNTIILLDQVEMEATSARASVRFFPDNRDGLATLTAAPDGFSIERPNAYLNAQSFSRGDIVVSADQLPLDEEFGVFPFAEVHSAASRSHEVLTILSALPEGVYERAVRTASADSEGWTIDSAGIQARITYVDGGVMGHIPDVEWL